MNIAICDDNPYIHSKLEEVIFEVFLEDKNQYSCDCFHSSESLLTYVSTNRQNYQLYLLDIEMAQMDGLTLATLIREKDSDAIIIFITSHQELMQEAFEVNAYHFLLKPLDYQQTKRVLLRGIESMKAKGELFQYKVRKRIFSLYLKEIDYFESNQRKIIIHTKNNQMLDYYGSLKEVVCQTPRSLFAQVHNSYVVNMERIISFDGNQVLLTSGVTILITKKYRQLFNKAYRQFVLLRRT